jgi:hypothetical protein
MKLMHPPSLDEGFKHLGWPVTAALGLGVVELLSVVCYLIPRTAVLGAVLLTGYLGGVIATHARLGEPVIAPIILESSSGPASGSATRACARCCR